MNARLTTRPGKPGTLVSGPAAERLFRKLKDHGFVDSKDSRSDEDFTTVTQGRLFYLKLRTATADVGEDRLFATLSLDLLMQIKLDSGFDSGSIQALANGDSGIGILEAHVVAPDSSPISLLPLAYPDKQHHAQGRDSGSRYEATLDLTAILGRLTDASVGDQIVSEVAGQVAEVLGKFKRLSKYLADPEQYTLRLLFAQLRVAQQLHPPNKRGDGLDEITSELVAELREQQLANFRADLDITVKCSCPTLTGTRYPPTPGIITYIADKPTKSTD
jgi:hypothetical protein